MVDSSVPPKLLLLALVLLLVAPVLQLQARKLGGSREQNNVGDLPSVLVLPSGAAADDDGAAAVVPPKLTPLPGVSRPGGRPPPAPQPGKRPQPGHNNRSPDVVSSPGVTGNHKLAPPAPAGNPPPHYRRLGPAAADLLRVFRDALVRVMWLLPEGLNRYEE